MKKVVDDFMVGFIYGKGVGVNVVVLVGEEFEVGEIFSDLGDFLFDFVHTLLQFEEFVSFRGVLEFIDNGLADKVASVSFGDAEDHLIVDFFGNFC